MGRICDIPGCESKYCARGLCLAHYTRWYRGKNLYSPIVKRRSVCLVDGCDRKHHSKGYCATHAWRKGYYGDPQKENPIRTYRKKVKNDEPH